MGQFEYIISVTCDLISTLLQQVGKLDVKALCSKSVEMAVFISSGVKRERLTSVARLISNQ